jgi:hypothetical protein
LRDIKSFDDVIKSFRNDLSKMLDQDDGKKIWEHFQRFAEYSDLKDLYKKCIPPLAKFEQKIIDFR